MAWIETAGGIALPAPQMGSGGFTISTLVDGGRNAAGNFIGSVVGEDKLKIEMDFGVLEPDQLARLLAVFDRSQGGQFVNRFRVYDPRRQDFVWMDMYVGDRTGRPLRVGADFVPLAWADVKANLIQV